MSTYPNALEEGDLGDPAWLNALNAAFLNHKARHAAAGADALDIKNLLDSTHKLGKTVELIVDAAGGGDYVDIQDAVDSVSGSDASIIVRKGSYGPVEYADPHNLSIIGQGRGITKIVSSSNEPLLKFTRVEQAVSFLELGGFSLVGPGHTNSLGHGIELDNIYAYSVHDLHVENCRDALHLKWIGWGTFERILVQALSNAEYICERGFYADPTAPGVMAWADKIFVIGTNSHAFYLERSNATHLLNCQALSTLNGGHGFCVLGESGSGVMDNCQADNTTGDAFHFEDVSFYHVKNPWCLPLADSYPFYAKSCYKLRVSQGEFWGKGKPVLLDGCGESKFLQPQFIANQEAGNDAPALEIDNCWDIHLADIKISSPRTCTHNAIVGTGNGDIFLSGYPHVEMDKFVEPTINVEGLKGCNLGTIGTLVTSAWGANQEGITWYDAGDHVWRYWNGSAVKTLEVVA